MIKDLRTAIRNDRNLQFILFFAFAIQIIFCITATGFYHTDQHFQVVEFSSQQLGDPSGFPFVWEYDHPVRSTIQVYLFSGYHLLLKNIGISDPYLELTILRIFFGVAMFILFNVMALYYFKDDKKIIPYSVLILLNFSWFLPYVKTLFSSEMFSSLLFFGAIFWYDVKKDKKLSGFFLLAIGFLLALAFYVRFQTGFFIAGFGLWMLLKRQNIANYLFMAIGFVAASILNTWLDYAYYQQLIITPYEYFYTNIIDKRAASFGSSSFLRYIGLLIAVVGVIPLSIILFFYSTKSFLKKYTHVIFFATIFFIIGHSMVGHKEERFMFPVLCVMPIFIGWGLPGLIKFYTSAKKNFRHLLKGIIAISIILNFLLLFLLMFNPYCQTAHFTSKLKNHFKKNDSITNLYFLNRTAFETESKVPLMFYKRSFDNLNVIRINGEELKSFKENDDYLAATFDQAVKEKNTIDSLGFEPVFYSSDFLWGVNNFLSSRKIQVINEIWVLYKKTSRQ